MRITHLVSGLITVSVLALAQPSQAAPDYELRNRMDRLEKELNAVRAASGGPASEAKLGVRISEVEEEVRKLRGLVEENQFRNDQLARELKMLAEDVQLRLQTLEASAPMPGMPPVATAPEATVPPVTSNGGRTMEDIVSEVAGDTRPQAPAAPTTLPGMKFNSPQEHYSHAFTLINRAQYAEAEQVLQSFVQQHPGDKLTGNAYYWLGETFYVRDKYLEAADAFRQGFETMPDGQKAPDNLLKLGMSLGKLNKKDQACVVLQQLQVKYQGKAQPVLERAAREAQNLGCK